MYKKMEQAIKTAQKAYAKNEVPIGAVIFKDGKAVCSAHNKSISKNNSLAHAEILAIQKALKKLNTTYLQGCELYVTVEPCMMCMGSIINARISKLVYGVSEAKTGFADSVANVRSFSVCNNIEIYAGIREEECRQLMVNFFKTLRDKQ